MGFYSPPSRTVVDAVLAPGYTPPTHDGSDAQLSDSGPYAYRPPSRTVVDAVLLPGYTAPDAPACDATLRRPLDSGEQKISPLGWDASTVSAAHVKLYLSFVQPIGWESGAVAAPTVRNAEVFFSAPRSFLMAPLRPAGVGSACQTMRSPSSRMLNPVLPQQRVQPLRSPPFKVDVRGRPAAARASLS